MNWWDAIKDIWKNPGATKGATITGGEIGGQTHTSNNPTWSTNRIDIDPSLLNRYKKSPDPRDVGYTPGLFDVDLFMNDHYGKEGFSMGGVGKLTIADTDLPLRSLDSIKADIDRYGGKQLFGGTVKIDPETGASYVEGGQRVPWAQLAGHMGSDRPLAGVSGGKKDFWEELQMLKEIKRMRGRGGGGSGVDKPPPFVYNWQRPQAPQYQRAGDFKWDGRDPHPPPAAQKRPEPYQRDRERYAKLVGY